MYMGPFMAYNKIGCLVTCNGVCYVAQKTIFKLIAAIILRQYT